MGYRMQPNTLAIAVVAALGMGLAAADAVAQSPRFAGDSLGSGTLTLPTGWVAAARLDDLDDLGSPTIKPDQAYTRRTGVFGGTGRAYIVSGPTDAGADATGIAGLDALLPRRVATDVARAALGKLGLRVALNKDDMRQVVTDGGVGYVFDSRQSRWSDTNRNEPSKSRPERPDSGYVEILVTRTRFFILAARAAPEAGEWARSIAREFEDAVTTAARSERRG